MLTNMLIKAASFPIKVSNVGYRHANNTGTLDYTFTNVDLGNASSKRLVVFYIAGASPSITTVGNVYVGGVLATLTTASIAGVRWSAIAYIETELSDADINIKLISDAFGSSNNIYMSVFEVYGYTSTAPVYQFVSPVNTNGTVLTTTSFSGNAAVVAGYSAGKVVGGTTATWTGIDETTDFHFSPKTTIYTDAASVETAGNVQVSVTHTEETVANGYLLTAAWS